MIRVAFTLIGGAKWTGGYNYLINLLRVLNDHAPERIAPVLFVGEDVPEADLEPFAALGTERVRDAAFDEPRRGKALLRALLMGRDSRMHAAFVRHRVQAIWEVASFFGWRTSIPTLAWMPDFQHRRLPHLFSRAARARRDLGLGAQLWSGRRIMLSSEDARADCEHFFPAARGRTEVVRFATPRLAPPDLAEARAVADRYGLPDAFFYLPNQFWIHKNHTLVVRALAAIRARGQEPPTVAASGQGEDPRRPGHFAALSAMIAEAGLSTSMPLLGLIPYPHVTLLMRASLALINPSLFEGWSTPVEEAKATGTPMLLSDLRVHREQFPEAIFFDPHDADALADAIMRFAPIGEATRAERAAQGAHRSVEAAAAFATAFADAIERTVLQHSR